MAAAALKPNGPKGDNEREREEREPKVCGRPDIATRIKIGGEHLSTAKIGYMHR
jgi:hypothetical protein